MKKDNKQSNENIGRLTQALVDDILSTPDDEILLEAIEDGKDIPVIVQNVGKLFEAAQLGASKARLADAKSAVKAYKEEANNVLILQPKDARKRLEKLLSDNSETAAELTMAARKGKELSDEDVRNMLEDLEELGVGSNDFTQE